MYLCCNCCCVCVCCFVILRFFSQKKINDLSACHQLIFSTRQLRRLQKTQIIFFVMDPLAMFDATDVHVAEVRIKGNNRTKDVVIERELQEAYQATNFLQLVRALDVAKERLRSLNVFKSVEIEIDTWTVDGMEEVFIPGKLVQLNVQCVEKNITEMNAGGFYSRNDFNGKLSATFRNSLGYAEELTTGFVMANTSDFVQKTLQMRVPRPLNTMDGTLSLTFRAEEDNFAKESSYTERKSGLSMAYTRLSDIFTHTFIYEGVWRDIRPVLFPGQSSSEQFLASSRVTQAIADQSFKSSLKYNIELDRASKNAHGIHVDGHQLKMETEVAGLGGDVTFLKSNVRMEKMTRMPGWLGSKLDMVLNFNVYFGALFPFGSDNTLARRTMGTRIHDRFFMGGPLEFPGYSPRGVAGERFPRPVESSKKKDNDKDESKKPKQENKTIYDALGGDLKAVSSLFVHMPLPLLSDLGMRITTGATIGNLIAWKPQQETLRSTWDRFSLNPRASAFLGLIIPTPLGQVFVTYARPLLSRDGDKEDHFGFSLGTGI